MIRRPPRSTRTDTHLPSRRSADLDLFGEDSYFADGELFWQMQNAAVAAKRDALLEVGWREVVVLERGRRFHEWEHEKTAKRKGGKVFVTVSPRGEIEFHEGWPTRQEARRAQRGGDAEPDARSEAHTSEIQSLM